MGEHNIDRQLEPEQLRSFMRSLLRELEALEQMIANGMIESDVHRIGAEQELFIVDQAWRPAPLALEILEALPDPHYTTEIGLFNLEINLDPLEFTNDCLSRMERELSNRLNQVRAVAQKAGAEVVLVGILPTIRKSDLDIRNLTPKPRYLALNHALSKLRGGAYEFRLKGTDELIVKHDSMMLEACCTSFQAHFQTDAQHFARLYNVAQVISAPVLAAAANSPLLFGRQLWRETRIPLFQQAVDTRSASYHLRERCSRVSFGQRWMDQSVLEFFREDIARFKVILGTYIAEDPFAVLQQGLPPELKAFRVFNGTVYRWNRPCYGIVNGKAHLRIEMRALPAGPTVADEVANAAFFYGLLNALHQEVADITKAIEFHHAEANFLAAAEMGLDAQLTWLGGRTIPAQTLIIHHLIPQARQGLSAAGIAASDIDRYLGILHERVASGQTGAQWLLNSFSKLKKEGTRDEVLSALTAATVNRQWQGMAVHQWPLAQLEEGRAMKPSDLRVEEFMTTDLFTVEPHEPLELVAHLMDWKHIRHVPVEDEQGRLVGLVSCFEIMRYLRQRTDQVNNETIAVSTIMQPDPITVTPETSMVDAIELMRRERVDSLPVVKDERLVGIVTEHDFVNIVARFLLSHNQQETAPHLRRERRRFKIKKAHAS